MNTNFLGKGLLLITLIGSIFILNAMDITQADIDAAGQQIKGYAIEHQLELNKEILKLHEPTISEQELAQRAPNVAVTDDTRYLWATSKLNTPAAKAWFRKNYSATAPVIILNQDMTNIIQRAVTKID